MQPVDGRKSRLSELLARVIVVAVPQTIHPLFAGTAVAGSGIGLLPFRVLCLPHVKTSLVKLDTCRWVAGCQSKIKSKR